MKDGKLGDYLLWEGQPAKIVGEVDRRAVVIETLENCPCPHCGESLGKQQLHVIVSSPQYQKGAEPMSTIEDDESIKVL